MEKEKEMYVTPEMEVVEVKSEGVMQQGSPVPGGGEG